MKKTTRISRLKRKLHHYRITIFMYQNIERFY